MLSLTLLVLLWLGSAATPVTLATQSSSALKALVGADIHPIDGPMIPGGTVIIEGRTIKAVGRDIAVPEGARQIDVSGRRIYPGFIHAWSQMGLSEISSVSETRDLNEHGTLNPNVRAAVAFHPESEHIPVARAHGITVTLSTPGGGRISGMASAMSLNGWTWEGMTVKGAAGLVVQWPSMHGRSGDWKDATEELRRVFEDASAYLAARKAAAGNPDPGFRSNLRWDALEPVFAKEIPVFVIAHQARQIQAAVHWGEETGVRLVIVGGYEADLVASLLAAREVPVILTSILNSPSMDWERYDQTYNLPARLEEAGVTFCIAGEATPAYAGRLPHHAATAAAFGLDREKALRAITLDAAKVIGIADRVGSITPGKDATFLVTNGDPLEFSTSIEKVFIAGEETELMNRHRRLYERFRAKYE